MANIEKEFSKYSYEILSENIIDYNISFKIIIIGDSGVGKSFLTGKAINKPIGKEYSATVGFEFKTFCIKINDKICKLQIWDTCGQEVYKSLVLNFYRNSSLAILVYSIDSESSLEHIENWKNEIDNNCQQNTKFILVGNKNDLEEKRQVTYEEGLEYSKSKKCDYFMETSAYTGYNVKNVFIKSAILLYEDYIANKYDNISLSSEVSDYKRSIHEKKLKQKCC